MTHCVMLNIILKMHDTSSFMPFVGVSFNLVSLFVGSIKALSYILRKILSCRK